MKIIRQAIDWFVFILFSGLTWVLYFPTFKAGFVMDFVGWQIRYENGNFADILNCFGYPGQHQLLHFFFYSLYQLFGTEGFAWFVVFSTLHATTAFLIYYFFKNIFKAFYIKEAAAVSFFGALMFLLLPYQTEVVVWKVCLHYLATAILLLVALYAGFSYLQKRSNSSLWLAHIAFLASLFFLEMAFITPVVILIFCAFYIAIIGDKSQWPATLRNLVIPQFLMLGGYFILNQLTLGQMVGHYGAEHHLSFPIEATAATAMKYLLKYSLFARYLTYDTQQTIYGAMEVSWILWLSVSVLSVLFIAGLIFLNRLTNRWRLSGMLLLLFFVAIAPVSNLFFYTLQYIENDRYGYHGSIFLMLLLALIIFRLSPKWRYLILAGWLSLSVLLLRKTTRIWTEGTDVYYSLLEDFRWQEAEKILVLNTPDNYKGMYLFRKIGAGSGLPNCLKYSAGKTVQGQIDDVVQYNMVTPQDGVTVSALSNDTLKISLNQWGNWWWRDGIGAKNMETSDFTFEKISNGYLLHLKAISPTTKIIYQDGKHWKEWK